MPTPDRTSVEEIVQAGRDILESDGLARLTMQAVAERVGVRPPSLYKRVRNRDDLVGLITQATVRDLGERLASVDAREGGHADLAAMTTAIRAFAHERPAGFALVFAARADPAKPDFATLAKAVAPVLRLATTLAGEKYALEAARMITAWVYGFVSMELAGVFNLGGDVEAAYEFGVARLVDALARSGPG